MWRLLTRYTRKSPIPCKQHDTTKFPNILANELCTSCESEICYICGNHHIEKGCFVRTSKISTQSRSYMLETQHDRESINQHIIAELNRGSLIYLNIEKLKCICGKPANEHTSLCAACGSATCSPECHKELESKELCRFHQNFTPEAQNVSLRSILLKNAYNLYDQGFAQGTVITRTSQHFLSAFLAEKRSALYLQRGYRQYGNPHTETLNAMDIVTDADLDREVHLMRACDCTCSSCQMMGYHAAFTCQHMCRSDALFNLRGFFQDQPHEANKQCLCRCDFCTSGHITLTHKQSDCLLGCAQRK